MKKSFYAITLSLSFALSLLTSCVNFLSGGESKDELTKQFERTKLDSVNLRLEPESKLQGAFKNNNLITCKVYDSIDLEFTVNPGYNFFGWSVVDQNDFSKDLSDCVTFSNSSESKRGSYSVRKTTVTVVKNEPGSTIWIMPLCAYLNDVTPPTFGVEKGSTGNDAGEKDVLVAVSKDSFYKGVFLPEYKESVTPTQFNNTASLLTWVKSRTNRTNKLYFRIKAYEKDSSIKAVVVEETFLRTTNNETKNETKVGHCVTGVTKVDAGVYVIEGEYTPVSVKDGIYRYDIYLMDGQNNVSKKYDYSFYALKDTNVTTVELEAYAPPYYDLVKDHKSDFIDYLNRVYVDIDTSKYGDQYYTIGVNSACDVLPDENIVYSISENGTDYTPVKVEYDERMAAYFDIGKLSRKNGLYVKAELTDFIGNTSKNVIYVPYTKTPLYAYTSYDKDLVNNNTCQFASNPIPNDPVFSNMVNDLHDWYGYTIRPYFGLIWRTTDSNQWHFTDYPEKTYLVPAKIIDFDKTKQYECYLIRYCAKFLVAEKACEAPDLYTCLASDLYTFSGEDVKAVYSKTFKDNSLAPEFKARFISEGVNTGLYTIKVTVPDFAEQEYDSIYGGLTDDPEFGTFTSGNSTTSYSSTLELNHIHYSNFKNYPYFLLRANKNKYYGDTVKVVVPPDENIAPEITSTFTFSNVDKCNYFGNTIGVSAADADSSIKKAGFFYSPEIKERNIEEIKSLNFIESKLDEKNRVYYTDISSLGKNYYQTYFYVEDTYGNYTYRELKFDNARIDGAISKLTTGQIISSASNYSIFKSCYWNNGNWTTTSGTKKFMYRVVKDKATEAFSYPFICYNVACNPAIKNINMNGGNWNSVLVSHDQPILCQTVYCERDLGTNPNDWMVYAPFENIVKTEVNEGTADKLNTYAYDLSTEVPSNNYYCGIIHFADGSVKMTDVMYKKAGK